MNHELPLSRRLAIGEAAPGLGHSDEPFNYQCRRHDWPGLLASQEVREGPPTLAEGFTGAQARSESNLEAKLLAKPQQQPHEAVYGDASNFDDGQ